MENRSPAYTEGALLARALSDFFTTRFMVLSTAPFLITMFLAFFLLFQVSGEFFDMLNAAAQASQNPDAAAAQNELAQFAKEYPIISAIAGSFVFKAVAGTLFYIVGGGVAVLASVIIAVIIVGFFTPMIVREIQKRHYPHVERKATVPVWDYLLFMLGQLTLFLLFLLVSLPFWFIPVLGIVAMNAPFYFLFHKLLTRDVAGEIFGKEEMKAVFAQAKWRIMTTTLILYLLSLIPGVGILGQVFFVIVLAHQFFQEAARLRGAMIKSI
ncbi:EI24 domain-containing protein [Hydrogenimonas urashimensis]|uniref:EI24 domain-containing protein n=1 Tax=Hydrogenimonas urashimensis TaxID=2740515 RepID=UPI001915203E|nr:EI24 domain-containing protein [Hydrogenimonas urashimensis]